MALYGQSVGVLNMLFTLGSVRDHLNKAVAIDPKYAYGGAYRILGKIDESLPGVLGGSRERARQYYEKAIEAAPDEPVNYFFLAKLLKYSYKDTAGARVVALKGMNVPPPEPFRAESIDGLVELQDFITTQLKE
jgi:tetratricopeptide (TPR) repeat protein